MSKTRTNRPNNTTSRPAPRMVHVSKEYVPVNLPNGMLSHYAPLKGSTMNLGRNKAKRAERARVKASIGATS